MLDGVRVEVHLTQELASNTRSTGAEEAIDLGYTEAFVDTEDVAYGERLGEIMTTVSNVRHKKRPALLVSEDLRHAFEFNRPKGWNRKLSGWVRGVMQDRIEFKALAEGFRHQQVNPAYGSQECNPCGFVDEKNRVGDRFVCQQCGHEDHADRNAALNYLRRKDDREITRYTPYREVKSILMERFHRRLEAESAQAQDATVPGRTPDDVIGSVHLPTGERKANAESHAPAGRPSTSRQHPASTRRAKRDENGIGHEYG